MEMDTTSATEILGIQTDDAIPVLYDEKTYQWQCQSNSSRLSRLFKKFATSFLSQGGDD